ncbi:hypothetical protein O181_034119 [Austropuccinia psidii MF-1]|uniref:Retrovirus-related Pol polyprotein from transposon TNT 1-94-like beta-barrel domain-containing protein n=1 Tax=Austropuccinia psidii MF-1 TaxID=1389203 RepID=A0A9Q3D0A8_9BASI|nr:hypothetical protein [Austropuccinia psidii MF-1]
MLTQKAQMNPIEPENNTYEQISRIRTTISQATALIKNEHMLKLDGSNFKSWENRLSIILDNFIDDASFLHREGPTLSSDEKICRGILIYSLPEEIQSEILHLRPCKAIYDHLRRLYHVITRAGQLSGLEELLNIRMEVGEAPSTYTLRLRTVAERFTQRGGIFTEDLILNLLLQRGIRNDKVAKTVMLRLENEIANKGQNPNLTTCHQILESAYQQHQNTAASKNHNDNIVFNQTYLNTTPKNDDQFDANNIDPAALKAKPTTTFTPPLNINSQFWAYYPIITPPSWPTPQYPGTADLNQPKTADYYRPNYQQKPMAPVNVRFAELGDEEDLMNLFQAEVTNEGSMACREPVCDTGATHSLTCNREALYQFQQLTNPLPLSVATKTGGRDSFVTGIGTLAFPGLNSETVLIKNVFYSPCATTTLISPASILRTGGKMYTQGEDLMFCNADQIPLLVAKFKPQQRRWLFPPCLKPTHLRKREAQYAHQIMSLKSRVGERDRSKCNDEILTWHKMFSHCGIHRLQNFLRDRLGANMSKHLNNTLNDCADCLISKSRHRSELLPTNRTTGPLDIVACDLMGPFEEANINSGRWALTVRDIGLTYSECHIIKAKLDAAAVLQGAITRWKVKTGKKLKMLRSDGVANSGQGE